MFSPRNGWDGDFAFCIRAHDALQIAIKPELGGDRRQGIEAGDEDQFFKFRVPLDCEWKSGANWKLEGDTLVANWLYIVGSICFLLGTVINMVWG